jgi:hypothetical protein
MKLWSTPTSTQFGQKELVKTIPLPKGWFDDRPRSWSSRYTTHLAPTYDVHNRLTGRDHWFCTSGGNVGKCNRRQAISTSSDGVAARTEMWCQSTMGEFALLNGLFVAGDK